MFKNDDCQRSLAQNSDLDPGLFLMFMIRIDAQTNSWSGDTERLNFEVNLQVPFGVCGDALVTMWKALFIERNLQN